MRSDNMTRPLAPKHSEPDIVDRLRSKPWFFYPVIRDAADEIERLRKLNAAAESKLAACGADIEQMLCDITEAKQMKCLVDIRWAVGDNGKRMQDELVEYIRSIVAERDALRRRIEEAPLLEMPCRENLRTQGPHLVLHTAWAERIGLAGKHVRLVVEQE